MRRAIDTRWAMLGLAPPETTVDAGKVNSSALSPEVQRTLSEHLSGNLNLKEELSPSSFTRHRKAIKAVYGIELDRRGNGCVVNPESLGHQLQYARRWEPKDHFRQLVLCEVTGPAKVLDLQRGIAFIADGEIPDIKDVAELDEWLKRWKKFAENEYLLQTGVIDCGGGDDSEDF
jgi:hypothetical protein